MSARWIDSIPLKCDTKGTQSASQPLPPHPPPIFPTHILACCLSLASSKSILLLHFFLPRLKFSNPQCRIWDLDLKCPKNSFPSLSTSSLWRFSFSCRQGLLACSSLKRGQGVEWQLINPHSSAVLAVMPHRTQYHGHTSRFIPAASWWDKVYAMSVCIKDSNPARSLWVYLNLCGTQCNMAKKSSLNSKSHRHSSLLIFFVACVLSICQTFQNSWLTQY